jgi:hypothetical protein
MAKAVKRAPKAKKPDPNVWTQSALGLLYERLVAKFGSYSAWKENNIEKSEELDHFLGEVARVVGAKDAGAVKIQINYATKANPINTAQFFTYKANNVSAARGAGFISQDEAAHAMKFNNPKSS